MSIVTEKQIIEVLKQCMDPEIPVDIWDLGLIYDINIEESQAGRSDVTITMTLTTPGCAMSKHISDDVTAKLEGLGNVDHAAVEIVWDPRWNTNMMSPEARKKLRIPEPKFFT